MKIISFFKCFLCFSCSSCQSFIRLSSFCDCPICGESVPVSVINMHLDSECFKIPQKKKQKSGDSAHRISSVSPSCFLFHKSPSASGHISSSSQSLSSSSSSSLSSSSSPLSTSEETTDLPSPHPLNPPSSRSVRAPLAEAQRPASIDQVVGVEAFAPGMPLRVLLEADRLPSLIFWEEVMG